jgi:UDP-xylose/UDP-N-acetylglucosamine transporter B4
MVFMRGHIEEHLAVLKATAPLALVPGVPAGLVWLTANLVTQAICIKGVFYLSASYSPLTVNLTLSVRKFCSVLLSVVLFNNPWSWKHVLASMMIFGGVFVYFNGPRSSVAAGTAKSPLRTSRTSTKTSRPQSPSPRKKKD